MQYGPSRAVAYLGGAMPPLGKSENIFWRDTLLKIGFQTYIFCSKVPSKCRKCCYRDQNFKKFRGSMPPDPPTIVSSLWPPLTKILATPLIQSNKLDLKKNVRFNIEPVMASSLRSFKKLRSYKINPISKFNTISPWFLSKTKPQLVILYRHRSRSLTSLSIS